VKELQSVFKALSDETRLKIIKLLQNGELCVCHLVAAFGEAQPKISFHLKVLKAANLVRDRRLGKWMYYRLNESDLFRRLLFLSVADRIDDAEVAEDRKRLERFMAARADEGVSAEASSKYCCREK
jgi:ArsR family transcriptional regulator